MPAKKILAVDDKPANLIALEALLGREYAVVTASSGVEALALLAQRTDFVLILMDVQMPGMDGFDCARRIKQMPDVADIPIIFITAVYNEDPFVKRGYAAGGVDYFTKPFDPDLLKLKIDIYASFRVRGELLRERERTVRASEELFHASRKLAAFLETVPIGVLVTDREGRVCQSNEEVGQIWGAHQVVEEDAYWRMLGWWDVEGHLIKDVDGPVARALRGETSQSVQLDVHALDGAPKKVVCRGAPLHDRRGDIAGAVVFLQDLTEGKRLKLDIEERVTQLLSAGLQLEASVRA